MAMHLGRDGGSDVKVEDVVDIARAAGHVIMEVYRSDSEAPEFTTRTELDGWHGWGPGDTSYQLRALGKRLSMMFFHARHGLNYCTRSNSQVPSVDTTRRHCCHNVIMTYQYQTWGSRFKSDDTPVTRADISADKLIRTRLLEAYPDIPIISEEAEQLPYEQRRHFGYCWIVDPLDGTKEFINRTGDFAVMIGLCLRGSPVLGVVHAPAHETPRTHYSVVGQGAFVLPGDTCGEGLGGSERISVRSFKASDSALRLAVSSSRPPEAFIAACDSPEIQTIGSAALKAIAVADGTADVFPCLYSTSEWDTCATHVIVEEAGGSVLRCDGSGEQGMAGVSLLLQGAKVPAAAAAAAVTTEEAAVAVESRLVDDLHLSYNKMQLSSPHCVFLGNCCSAPSTAQDICT